MTGHLIAKGHTEIQRPTEAQKSNHKGGCNEQEAPFYGVMFAVLMLVTYGPAISLWLPRLLGL